MMVFAQDSILRGVIKKKKKCSKTNMICQIVVERKMKFNDRKYRIKLLLKKKKLIRILIIRPYLRLSCPLNETRSK